MATDFLQLEGKTFLVFGVANKKSVAWHAGKTLEEAGATVLYVVRSDERREQVRGILNGPVFVCNVEHQEEIDELVKAVSAEHNKLDGMLHSIAFANYSEGFRPFHETPRGDFLQAANISAYSLIALSDAFAPHFNRGASVVTVSISTTRMAAEGYGYMAPIKAALESSVVFLAKSFAGLGVRFNSVNPGLLKTSSSAGIPGYVNSYLFAEMATLRKGALETTEVGNTIAFLLSPRSSGINAQGIVIDAGMSANYFDRDIVGRATSED